MYFENDKELFKTIGSNLRIFFVYFVKMHI